jgi:hypothetical protein
LRVLPSSIGNINFVSIICPLILTQGNPPSFAGCNTQILSSTFEMIVIGKGTIFNVSETQLPQPPLRTKRKGMGELKAIVLGIQIMSLHSGIFLVANITEF